MTKQTNISDTVTDSCYRLPDQDSIFIEELIKHDGGNWIARWAEKWLKCQAQRFQKHEIQLEASPLAAYPMGQYY